MTREFSFLFSLRQQGEPLTIRPPRPPPSGGTLATEAVAGTRGRGADESEDAALAYDLLTCPKEHAEFTIVQDWVASSLRSVCLPGSVALETEKTVLRNGPVQHLYSRLAGAISPAVTESEVLGVLHPTPAVCGAPRAQARAAVAAREPFDRGFYAGPFGWIGGGGAEFAVAIRSALLSPSSAPAADPAAAPGRACGKATLFAGVGVVQGAHPAQEWSELNLKIRQFEDLLRPAPSVLDAPNINLLWAALVIEELLRLGVQLFAIAPGSRSTPLAVAAARNPRARTTVCIDERSLAFHALGA